jgi:tRNA-specific 2-thiouridylase
MSPAKKVKSKVLIALSGGVDSAVSAALLVQAGYNVTAAYMVNYEGTNRFGESCWVTDYRDAVRVAAHLGIPIQRWDFVQEYKDQVLEYMFAEYKAGRTPNPDILCNKFVKFGAWLDKAKSLGFDYLATGHYARIAEEQDSKSGIKSFSLLQARDDNKDQTYFLNQLNQRQLSHTLFPIGGFTKPEVRLLAKKLKLPVADKEESMGICFIGEVSMVDFLKQRIKPQPGKIVLSTGEVIGEHEGLPFYTIGQRHIGSKSGHDNRPLYILAKDREKNQLIVGFEDDPLLYQTEIMVSDVNWIASEPPLFPLKCAVRLRHRQELQECVIHQNKDQSVTVSFSKPQRAVAPGQFAVFYLKGECFGGGAIA